jgi:hypothetical protein
MKTKIFLLTDGDVSSPQTVIELAKGGASSGGASIHSFGLGNGCNRELVKNVAIAGRGTFSFVYEKDNLKIKVVSALNKACQPSLKNCSISNSIEPLLVS